MHRVTEITLDKHPGVMSHIQGRTGLNGIKTCPFICNVLSERCVGGLALSDGQNATRRAARRSSPCVSHAIDDALMSLRFGCAIRRDKLPDVLDAPPPRPRSAPARQHPRRSRPTRRAETARAIRSAGSWTTISPPSPYRGKLALEALDVEEARAAELADCTIEVLANSRPAPLTPIPIPAESDEIDSEDELESARNLAARVADELRCQRYFDDKTAAARLGRDPVLSSPAWIDARPETASPRGRMIDPRPKTTNPRPRRDPSPLPGVAPHLPRPPSTPPRGRGAAVSASPLGSLRSRRARRRRRSDASFESVKNGLYELFCRSAEGDGRGARDEGGGEPEMRTDMRTETRAETMAETVAETALDRRRTNGTTSAETRSTHPTHPMSPDASMCGFADISPIVPYRDEDHDEDATDLTSRGYIFETDAPFEPFESGFESPRATTRIGPGSPPPGPPSRARKTRSRTADDFADAMDLSATATRLGLRMDDVADARAPNTPDVSEDDAETVVSEPRSAAKKREEEEEEEDEEEATAMALAVARAVSDATETAFDDEDAPAPRCESCGRCVPSFPLGRASRSSTSRADPGGNDADVSDAEDDSARAEDDFDRHVLARTPRARVSSRRRRRRRSGRLRPGASPSVWARRRTNEPRARRRSGGRRRAFVVCERIRRSSRDADRREASPREGDASRDVCRASVSFRPRRLHEVRGDGVARDACQSEPGRRVVRRAEREDDVVLPGRFGVARVGRAAAQGVGELLTRGGRRRSRPGKWHRRGETARFRRARDGGFGTGRGTRSVRVHRGNQAHSRRRAMTETRRDDGDEMG